MKLCTLRKLLGNSYRLHVILRISYVCVAEIFVPGSPPVFISSECPVPGHFTRPHAHARSLSLFLLLSTRPTVYCLRLLSL